MSSSSSLPLSDILHRSAVSEGVLVANGDYGCKVPPLSLVPARLPIKEYQRAFRLGKIFHRVFAWIAEHPPLLIQILEPATREDGFLARLLAIYKIITSTNKPSSSFRPTLSFFRADYMLEAASEILKLVEVNTFAVAFNSLARRVQKLHSYISRPSVCVCKNSPKLLGIEDELARAHRYYVKNILFSSYDQKTTTTVILFVVQPGETNIYDQTYPELALWETHGISCVRLTLGDVFRRCCLDPETRTLMLESSGDAAVLISVVYFRAGYAPEDYPSEAEWSAREMMERSNAICCPWIGMHLAGTKRVQQHLTCIPVRLDPSETDVLQTCLVDQHALDCKDEQTIAALVHAVAHPDCWVIKPQREGGGNLIYGLAVEQLATKALASLLAPRCSFSPSLPEYAQYTLMKRIVALEEKNCMLVRDGELCIVDGIHEYGFFSSCFQTKAMDEEGGHDDDENQLNENQVCFLGNLVRTKKVGVEEGGVSCGASYLSSLIPI